MNDERRFAAHFTDNLGLFTDLLLLQETGIVDAEGDYVVARTPDVPDYFFGNLLFLRQRPTDSDIERIEHDFARLVGTPPRIAHRTFVWPETPEAPDNPVSVDAWVRQGYDLTTCRVLAAQPHDLRDVAINPRVEVRRLKSRRDWNDWSRMHLADLADPSALSTRRYMAYLQATWQCLIERGLGDCWGAFIEGELAGSLGLFFFEGLGRFQSVITAQRHRNQRVCKTLVSEAIGLTAGRAEKLVMVADEAHYAGAIYESIGFRPHGRVASLCQEPDFRAARPA
ncbi:GNAT family N-acetyltransferase [Paraburkholderia acidipaludis]|uniref:GNAT family N-acetyltransferase n=1 Tax=Paraburkholderia acidipaludis TaxID=660537 RepID=UPI000482BB45|nr:GNAT family N-acetyltransferase [Paraburkholderia acidipaludis]